MFRKSLIATVAIMSMTLVFASMTFAQKGNGRNLRSGQMKTAPKNRKSPAYTDGGITHDDSWEEIRSTNKQPSGSKEFSSTMMEGSNIRRKQPRTKIPDSAVNTPIGNTSGTIVNPGDDKKPVLRPNRRKFDHIGNVVVNNETNAKPKSSRKEFSGTMMEGSNIRRKQPRKGKRP